MNLLREYIRQILQEKQRFAKETGDKFGSNQDIERQIRSKDPSLLVHFSELPKFGINPSSYGGGTPFGIYGWIVNEYSKQIWRAMKGEPANFAHSTSRRYMHFFRIKPEAMDHVLNIGEWLPDLQKYKDILGATEVKLQHTTLRQGDLVQRKALMDNGVWGIMDTRQNIYLGEPGQAVIFLPNIIEYVGMVDRDLGKRQQEINAFYGQVKRLAKVMGFLLTGQYKLGQTFYRNELKIKDPFAIMNIDKGIGYSWEPRVSLQPMPYKIFIGSGAVEIKVEGKTFLDAFQKIKNQIGYKINAENLEVTNPSKAQILDFMSGKIELALKFLGHDNDFEQQP